MKLITKFTLWYLCIALTCTVVGTAITYYSIKDKIDNAAIERLKTINRLAAEQVSSGQAFDSVVQGRKVKVTELKTPLPDKNFDLSEIKSIDPVTNKAEYRLTVNSYYSIKGKNYSIASYGYVSKAEQILSGLKISILWKWALILFLIAISATLVSGIILSPFKETLHAIDVFNIKNKKKIHLPATSTKEFKELNNFVKSMTDKAVEEYIALKEFTENASHELQTPVAVMGMKLELLAESAITDQQAMLISDIQGSLEKLSRINSSLVLLTRLENHEYATKEPLRFCRLINETLESYRELIEMKSLRLSKDVSGGVHVQLNHMLGQLLLNNLISNAIRHNTGEGIIHLELTHRSLIIKNTGEKPLVPTSELFQRFKKSNQSSKSIGIGLAIVKQICEIHHFDIRYDFTGGYHIIEISFTEINPPSADALQMLRDGAVPETAIYTAL
jgi:signal transduction histidine kinase